MTKIKYLFLIPPLYFILGFINIIFAMFMLLCMALPLFFLFKNKKKTWCQGYCPRSSFFDKMITSIKVGGKTPLSFIKGRVKWYILGYFCVNVLWITISTILVAVGQLSPSANAKFLMVFKLPLLPQLLHWDTPVWLTHLSYGFYSMMLTTTFVGLVLALIYKPRTWCTVCPIMTVSNLYIGKKAK